MVADSCKCGKKEALIDDVIDFLEEELGIECEYSKKELKAKIIGMMEKLNE